MNRTHEPSSGSTPDLRPTIGTSERKGRDSNPLSPRGIRLSGAARPTISGSLPYDLNFSGPARESNPDLLLARQASFRWTSRPSPLNRQGPPGARTRTTSLPRRHAASNTCGPEVSRPGRTRTCDILFVRQASWPLDDGTRISSRGGSRTHTHQPLRLAALPFAYPAIEIGKVAGMGVELHPSEFMRLGRAPAHPRVPGPGIEPGGRPYESRLGARHARDIHPILSIIRGEE